MNIQDTRRKCLLQHSLLHQLEVSIIVLSVSPIVNNAVVVVSIDVDHLLAKLDYFEKAYPRLLLHPSNHRHHDAHLFPVLKSH